MATIKEKAKKIIAKLDEGILQTRAQFSAGNRKRFWRGFASANTEKHLLTREQKAAVRAYFKPFSKVTMIFHNFYTEKTGEFCVNYIPDDLHSCKIDPYFNNWAEAEYVDNKCMYSNLFKNVTHAKNVLWRSNGLWFCENSAPLSRTEVNAVLAKHNAVFLKVATSSHGGKGVFFLTGANKETDFWKHSSSISNDLVVQEPIVQHEQLNRINSSSVNTIRALSVLHESGVKIYSCILRMGINGAKVDNASSGGITCGIDSSGKLRKYAYTSAGTRFEEHPNSKIRFEGFEIPGFDKMQELIPLLHCQIPHFRMVSWDIAIQENGEPILVEANLCNGELDFHQLNNGPLFGDDTQRILCEVFGKKKA